MKQAAARKITGVAILKSKIAEAQC